MKWETALKIMEGLVHPDNLALALDNVTVLSPKWTYYELELDVSKCTRQDFERIIQLMFPFPKLKSRFIGYNRLLIYGEE